MEYQPRVGCFTLRKNGSWGPGVNFWKEMTNKQPAAVLGYRTPACFWQEYLATKMEDLEAAWELIGNESSQDIKVEWMERQKYCKGFFKGSSLCLGCFSGFIFRKPKGFWVSLKSRSSWVVVEAASAQKMFEAFTMTKGSTVIGRFQQQNSRPYKQLALYCNMFPGTLEDERPTTKWWQ